MHDFALEFYGWHAASKQYKVLHRSDVHCKGGDICWGELIYKYFPAKELGVRVSHCCFTSTSSTRLGKRSSYDQTSLHTVVNTWEVVSNTLRLNVDMDNGTETFAHITIGVEPWECFLHSITFEGSELFVPRCGFQFEFASIRPFTQREVHVIMLYTIFTSVKYFKEPTTLKFFAATQCAELHYMMDVLRRCSKVQERFQKTLFLCKNSWERKVVHACAEFMGLEHVSGDHPTQTHRIVDPIVKSQHEAEQGGYSPERYVRSLLASKHSVPMSYVQVAFNKKIRQRHILPHFPSFYLPDIVLIIGQYMIVTIE